MPAPTSQRAQCPARDNGVHGVVPGHPSPHCKLIVRLVKQFAFRSFSSFSCPFAVTARPTESAFPFETIYHRFVPAAPSTVCEPGPSFNTICHGIHCSSFPRHRYAGGDDFGMHLTENAVPYPEAYSLLGRSFSFFHAFQIRSKPLVACTRC